MGNLWSDLRYGVRLLVKSPGFTLVALFTLALGIGANTAIFSVLDAVLLRPLPYAEPERLAMIWEDASFASFPKNTPSPANYWDWKQRNHSFVDMAAIRTASVSLTDGGAPEFVVGVSVTSNLLPVLGIKPLIGRNFTPEEDRSAATLVVLGHGLWKQRFGGDAGIIGRSIRMSGVPHTVIGVMPPGFNFPSRNIAFWRPIGFGAKEYTNRGQHFLRVVGRLKPGVTWDSARADLSAVTVQIIKENPNVEPKMGSVVVPLHEEFVGNTRVALWMLLGASVAVLLIGCANLANLLMARGSVRTREMALRLALGAGRGRLVVQLLTESLLLAGLGGLLGLVLARVSLRLLEYLVPNSMVSFVELGIDMRLFAFTMGISLLTGVVFGLAPAWQAVRLGLNDTLKLGGRSNAGVQGQGLRHALVVVEVGMAVTLVAGAGLLIQSLLNLGRIDVGFRAEKLFTAVTALPAAKYQTMEQRMGFYERVLEAGAANAWCGGGRLCIQSSVQRDGQYEWI
jgi:predicted permease